MKITKLLTAAFLPLFFIAPSSAQDGGYPTRPIRLIVGFSAGGATDVSARLFAKKMGDVLGQPVIVETKLGAAGTISADYVARSPADGYTLLYTTSSIHAISPHLYTDLKWDPVKDFAPIALAAKYPQVLLVNNDLPVKTLSELVALMKKNPNKYSYASAGVGGTQHMAGAILAARAHVDAVHVPYKGMSAAYPDLIAGRVQIMFDNSPSAIPFVNDRRVRALAVSSAERVSNLPDVPTIKESGFPDFDINGWSGFVAPAGTPQAIIDKLNMAVIKSSQSPEVQQWLTENGSPTNLSGTPAEFATFLKDELAFWKGAVELSGAKQQQ
ncbi:Bug family tripartite tricarboxylate transporter substrate binding protein [Pollutimonas bauzanensis]|uniref:Tripartite-type tricarboxylate transporter, receptor component TctC n=1 Tax=Pollutimonas bauzanensis TaxID=658167 RepID=A0A1M5X035_9BURK|nr:tripartite tricarboxylate transporter substrate binding protein [Pollutimonas bauzanensis]SHH92888.1 Tripartite-type tricarboxylate transporter, receptor component TctC [Pollutimonas bauzanensis]